MDENFNTAGISSVAGTSYDAGLRAHMQRVYNYMAGGLALTGLLAWVVANTALAGVIFGTPLRWLIILAPLGFVMFMQIKMQSLSAGALRGIFWAFCSTMGLSMGALFLIFTNESIARTFFITAATFGSMSLWGYTTKRDLTGFGSFLMMGVLGLFIAMAVNIFMHSPMLQWVSSVVGVAIFTGLAAWDTQRIKETYSAGWGSEANDKLAVFGALSLYMDFINAFQFLLQLTGQTRRD
jgi:FtsH-binding integral membrane protein